MTNAAEIAAAARESKAWPYEEARRLAARLAAAGEPGRPALFATGYGPSGLPHIGTWNEVARTTMVRRAYEELTGGAPTRLIAFSDDMDGLRKVPDNVPRPELLAAHLGHPLSAIPDPFGTHESYAAHNNAMLRDFLDRFGFDYEFLSATDCYRSGRFDETLRLVLARHDEIMAVMLPTLRAERRATYAPVLPISRRTGIVLQVPVEVVDAGAGTIRYVEDGEEVVASALGGAAKLQWKVDWAMRWVALGVDYEMAGKDLIDSVIQSGRIARVLGGRPPEGFNYEMFLDEHGQKISKTKGNGLSLEQWFAYGPPESLAYYVYREPKRAKTLHAGVIPRAIDDYWQSRAQYGAQPLGQRLGNPVHHVHAGAVPAGVLPVSYGLLLNLVALPGVADAATVWGFLRRYDATLSPETHPALDTLVGHALAYGRDHGEPSRHRAPTLPERTALAALDAGLAAAAAAGGNAGEDPAAPLQNLVYEIGKAHYGKDGLRDWFRALYETLLGSSEGPRMGSFIALYGIAETRALIAAALAR